MFPCKIQLTISVATFHILLGRIGPPFICIYEVPFIAVTFTTISSYQMDSLMVEYKILSVQF